MDWRSETIEKIAPALIAFQSELPAIAKDKDNPYFKSKYADLATISEAIKSPLAANKLAYTQHFEQQESQTVCVTTVLLHESGEWLANSCKLPVNKADAQGYGSAITYARRYGLSALLGLVSEDDEDGNAASEKPKSKTREKQEARFEAEKNNPDPAPEVLLKQLHIILTNRYGSDSDAKKSLLEDFFKRSIPTTKSLTKDEVKAFLSSNTEVPPNEQF
jgi:hypothetical protein